VGKEEDSRTSGQNRHGLVSDSAFVSTSLFERPPLPYHSSSRRSPFVNATPAWPSPVEHTELAAHALAMVVLAPHTVDGAEVTRELTDLFADERNEHDDESKPEHRSLREIFGRCDYLYLGLSSRRQLIESSSQLDGRYEGGARLGPDVNTIFGSFSAYVAGAVGSRQDHRFSFEHGGQLDVRVIRMVAVSFVCAHMSFSPGPL
jgi:hypothetical protein